MSRYGGLVVDEHMNLTPDIDEKCPYRAQDISSAEAMDTDGHTGGIFFCKNYAAIVLIKFRH